MYVEKQINAKIKRAARKGKNSLRLNLAKYDSVLKLGILNTLRGNNFVVSSVVIDPPDGPTHVLTGQWMVGW